MKTLLSIVTPVYRGEQYLGELVRSINNLREKIKSSDCPLELVEVIFVLDGATDNSTAVLDDLCQQYPWVRAIHLSNNFGQHPATMAGILFSVGDWIVTLDEDLQHQPRHILELLRTAVYDGLDVVYAKSTTRTHSHFRDLTARATKRIIGSISNNPNIDSFNSFRLVRGDIARAAAGLASSNTYFDVALGWFTNRVGIYAVPLSDPRKDSRRGSGYSLKRLINHGIDLAITSEMRVLRLGIVLGVIGVASSIVVTVFTLLVVLLNPFSEQTVPMGWPSISVGIMFFGGLMSLMLGIGLEYIGNLYTHSQGKPTFFIIDRKGDRDLTRWFQSNSA